MRRVFWWVTCLLMMGCVEGAGLDTDGDGAEASDEEWVLLGEGEAHGDIEDEPTGTAEEESALTTTRRVSGTSYFQLTNFSVDLRGLLARTRTMCPAKILKKGPTQYLFFWNTKYKVNVGWNATTRVAKVLDPIGMSFETKRSRGFAGVGGEARIDGPRYMSPLARASMVRDMKATLGGLSHACR